MHEGVHSQSYNRCTRTAAKRFSSDAPGSSEAGFAASARLQRRSVIFVVGRIACWEHIAFMNIERTEFAEAASKAGIPDQKIAEVWASLEIGSA